MTTEDAIQRHLNAHPDDHTARLALADWLEENAGEVPCEKCGGEGGRWETTRGNTLFARMKLRCPVCSGSGRVSDGRRERAAGYRALGVNGKWPYCPWLWLGRARDTHCPWFVRDGAETGAPAHTIPDDWFAAVSYPGKGKRFVPSHWLRTDGTRRELEDAVARAFAALPADRQRELLTPAETPA